MTLRQLRNSFLLLLLTLCTASVTHAASIKFESSLPEGSAALPGEVIQVDIYVQNEKRDQVISTQVRIEYPADVLERGAYELNDALFDVPLPSEDGEGYIIMGGGSTRGGSNGENILIGSVSFTVKSTESRGVEIRINEEDTSIMAAQTDGVENVLEKSSTLLFGIGDFIPPKTSIVSNTNSKTVIPTTETQENTGTGSVLHGSAGEQPPVIVDAEMGVTDLTMEAPKNISYITSGNSLTLRWETITNARSYYVYWSTNGRDFIHRTKVTQNQFSSTDFQRGEEVVFVISAISYQGKESMRSVAIPVIIGRQTTVTTTPPYIAPPIEQLYESAPLNQTVTTTSPELPQSGGSVVLVLGILGVVLSICKVIHNARKKHSMVY